jgi:gamma-glutamyltranspeptidase
VPDHGWLPVTVPGAPAAWRDLHQRFGTLPFARVIEPAANYAEHGHPASPISVWHWRWEMGGHMRGHTADVWNELDAYGRGQIIWRLPSCAYIAGSDHRGDGQASGY